MVPVVANLELEINSKKVLRDPSPPLRHVNFTRPGAEKSENRAELSWAWAWAVQTIRVGQSGAEFTRQLPPYESAGTETLQFPTIRSPGPVQVQSDAILTN